MNGCAAKIDMERTHQVQVNVVNLTAVEACFLEDVIELLTDPGSGAALGLLAAGNLSIEAGAYGLKTGPTFSRN